MPHCLAWLVLAVAAPELTLEAALAQAVRAQPSLIRAQHSAQQLRGVAHQQRAALLPQLTATGGYARSTSNFVVPPGNVPRQFSGRDQASMASTNYLNGGLAVTQLITDFGETWGSWRQADLAADAGDAAARVALLDLQQTVRNAFYDAVAKRALCAVAAVAEANQARHRAQVESFVEVGKRPEIDRLQAATDYASAQLDAIGARRDYQLALATLQQAIGSDAAELPAPAAPDPSPVAGEAAPLAEMVAEARATRPEYARLQRALDGAAAAARSALGTNWPALSATASLTDAGPEPDALTWNWSLGVRLQWPLLTGGAQLAEMAQARASCAMAAADLRAQALQVQLELARARLGVAGARAALGVADGAAANARQLLELAEGRYAAGLGGIIELGDAQVAATRAAVKQVQEQQAVATARAALLRALGRAG